MSWLERAYVRKLHHPLQTIITFFAVSWSIRQQYVIQPIQPYDSIY